MYQYTVSIGDTTNKDLSSARSLFTANNRFEKFKAYE